MYGASPISPGRGTFLCPPDDREEEILFFRRAREDRAFREAQRAGYAQPLVIHGEVRTCPGCGAYRDWIVFCLRDDSVWLRCRAGHETKELGLDAAWYNRNSGPVDRFHPTLEEGLRHLGP